MNSTELIKKATESFERLDKSYNVDRVDYTKGYIACYMDVVNESKVIHNVISTFKCSHGLDCKEPCVMYGKGKHSMCY